MIQNTKYKRCKNTKIQDIQRYKIYHLTIRIRFCRKNFSKLDIANSFKPILSDFFSLLSTKLGWLKASRRCIPVDTRRRSNVFQGVFRTINICNGSVCKKIEVVARRCPAKKLFLKIFSKLTGEYLCQSLFFKKVGGLRLATLSKKRMWYRRFPVNIEKFNNTFL